MKTTLLVTLMVGMLGVVTAQAAEKTMTPQQQRMQSCNQQATASAIKGDAHKTFMSTCLKKK